ncbi:hypothetical protein [[Kitasatospora] papulosa]|uniref:hypothetical protein n=1 Tax=[Kitasatospora] papulosa TaxID=1464011 RepID=UPI003688C518
MRSVERQAALHHREGPGSRTVEQSAVAGGQFAPALSSCVCAWDDAPSHDGDHVAVLTVAEVAALVLGFLVELPVSIAMALFG